MSIFILMEHVMKDLIFLWMNYTSYHIGTPINDKYMNILLTILNVFHQEGFS